MKAWEWVSGTDGVTLVDEQRRSRAIVWSNGAWHTFDEDGVGGENSQEDTVFAAKGAAMGSLILQGWAAIVAPEVK